MAEKKKKKRKLRMWVRVTRNALVILCLGILFNTFIAKRIVVSGESMWPTLYDRETGILNIVGKKIDGIDRFDIVVVGVDGKYIIKRVIGLPGETIEFVGDKLYVDGEYVEQEFLSDGVHTYNITKITLGEDEYYCLGDNRENSMDSRYYGPFKDEQISGIAVFW